MISLSILSGSRYFYSGSSFLLLRNLAAWKDAFLTSLRCLLYASLLNLKLIVFLQILLDLYYICMNKYLIKALTTTKDWLTFCASKQKLFKISLPNLVPDLLSNKQDDQLNMVVFFWYLVKRVHVYNILHWTDHFKKITRKPWQCLLVTL